MIKLVLLFLALVVAVVLVVGGGVGRGGSHQYVRPKERKEAMRFVGGASGRHERPTVLQDPAKRLAAVVTVLNDQYMHAIEAGEVGVHLFKVRQRARRMVERG